MDIVEIEKTRAIEMRESHLVSVSSISEQMLKKLSSSTLSNECCDRYTLKISSLIPKIISVLNDVGKKHGTWKNAFGLCKPVGTAIP